MGKTVTYSKGIIARKDFRKKSVQENQRTGVLSVFGQMEGSTNC